MVLHTLTYICRELIGIGIPSCAPTLRHYFLAVNIDLYITTIIKDNVLLYQGVTLGGTGNEHGKRHPTLGNNIVIGAGAKVLGNIEIGSNSRIGAGSVVVDNVPENSTVVGVPGKIVKQKIMIQGQLMHNRIPDPVTCQLNRLKYEIQDIKEEIDEIKNGR